MKLTHICFSLGEKRHAFVFQETCFRDLNSENDHLNMLTTEELCTGTFNWRNSGSCQIVIISVLKESSPLETLLRMPSIICEENCFLVSIFVFSVYFFPSHWDGESRLKSPSVSNTLLSIFFLIAALFFHSDHSIQMGIFSKLFL